MFMIERTTPARRTRGRDEARTRATAAMLARDGGRRARAQLGADLPLEVKHLVKKPTVQS